MSKLKFNFLLKGLSKNAGATRDGAFSVGTDIVQLCLGGKGSQLLRAGCLKADKGSSRHAAVTSRTGL